MSVLTGIDSIKANLNVDFNNGVFYKLYNKEELFLKIAPNTTADCYLEVTNAAITKITYKFSQPLIFKEALKLNASGVYVSEISIANNSVTITSQIDDKIRSYLNADQRILNNLKKLFNLPGQFSDLLSGRGFGDENASVWVDCTNNFIQLPTKRSIIQRITTKSGEQTTVSLKSNWKFIFNDSQEYDNYILTSGRNALTIADLMAEPGTKNLIVNIKTDLSNVTECKIQSKAINLLLPKPKFDHFTILLNNNADADGKRITIHAGLNSNIQVGSKIQIMSAKSTSSLNIAAGSSISLKDIVLDYSGDSKSTIKLGLGSSVALQLENSDINLNNLTTIHFSKGSIARSSIAAEFYSDRDEDYWQGNLYDVAFQVDGGIIGLNQTSALSLKSGSIMSKSLNIDNTINPQITGKFDVFTVNLTSANDFSCGAKGFKFRLKDNCTIAQDDSDPVDLEKDEEYPLGTLRFHFEYSKFLLNDQNQFSLNDGTFESDFKNVGKGVFSGRKIKLNGSLNVQVKDKAISTQFDLLGKIDFSKQLGPDFVGVASFVINPLATPVSIETPCLNDDQIDWSAMCDEHIFPVALNINLKNPIFLSGIKVEIKKGLLKSFSSQTAGQLDVMIPPGYGEYDGDNLGCDNIHSNIHNEDRGDDDIKKLQEVARATVCARRCTWHIWAESATYTVPFTLNFEYNISDETLQPSVVLYPKIDLSNIVLGYKRHGCDDLLTSLATGLFIDIDKKIKDMAQTKLNELSDKFSQSIMFVP